MVLLLALALAVVTATHWRSLWLLQAELAPQTVQVFGAPTHPPGVVPAPQPSDTTLRWIVLGDWGTGGVVQQRVARAMAALARKAPIHFVLSTGDNIYPSGVRSAEDPQWVKKFERIYADSALRVPWYPVLGNHDYRGDPDAQIAYSRRNPRWHMPARYYSLVHFLPDSSPVLFLALDTQALLAGGEARREQLQWLEAELQRFPGAWKFVWGHHPLRSAGVYGENQTLVRLLKPLFDRFGVAVYFCGHEHDLQALKAPQDRFVCIVSGAGSSARSTQYGPFSLYAASEPGFVYAALGKQTLQLWFITADGVPRYSLLVPRPQVSP